MKVLRLFGLIVGTTLLNVIVLSPGMIGISISKGNPFETAFGITFLLASILGLTYGSYVLFFKTLVLPPIKQLKTPEDYAEGLSRFKRVSPFERDISFALGQLERIKKKIDTLLNVLNQRFDPSEMSYKKFNSVTSEVENLFYLNVRSLLNRLHVFDESEFECVMDQQSTRFSSQMRQEKVKVFNEYISFVKNSIDSNEEILLKLDKLILEISRLDSFEPGDIENMTCMQEIDSLIKQTKLYKQ